ncbi:hypothetical protein F7731_23785 [Cytobacillus depressus]|uniref:Uncharacterized protein n=1 Tax=Cytobacillus depressus TaxID=1602942 RepID=A0A6L3UY56_9BACI|nr:hypothetical protein [Cytobacillus depressus]KAB2328974.1 hypothetical protein F7731_23785 [Cytobacillus depressus]
MKRIKKLDWFNIAIAWFLLTHVLTVDWNHLSKADVYVNVTGVLWFILLVANYILKRKIAVADRIAQG